MNNTSLYENIPEALQDFNQWMHWRYEQGTKPPINPFTNQKGSKTNPEHWASFEDAVRRQNGNNGLGFVFTNDDPFCGIDLDACRNPKTGELSGWAQNWIDRFDSYSEVSPSGTGVKVWVRGKLPDSSGKQIPINGEPSIGGKNPQIEIYDRAAYFCVTGQRLPGLPDEPQERQSVIDEFFKTYFPKSESGKKPHFDTAGTLKGVPEGQRDVACWKLACKLLNADVPIEMALSLILEAAKNCTPEFPADNAREKVERAYKTYKPKEKNQKSFTLDDFVINDEAESMEKQMLDDKFVLGRIALLGQSTVMYSKPSAGKTLLSIWLLRRAITKGDIDGSAVFYINADDSHKGLVYKLKLANKYGFKMLAPGYKNFKAEQLPIYLQNFIESNTAKGKVVILDTVKKFTDLMKKDRVSVFSETIRQFILHGGTVIMLAHVNKHRDDEGKVIYSGTSDLPDDVDCAYTLDIITEEPTGLRTVMFENFKARGDVVRRAVYQYDARDSISYGDRLESVVEVGEQEREAAERQKRLDKILESNRAAVEVIKECLREGVTQKTALINEAHERSELSKKQIAKALADHTGNDVTLNQFWHINKADNNAHVFQINYSVF